MTQNIDTYSNAMYNLDLHYEYYKNYDIMKKYDLIIM